MKQPHNRWMLSSFPRGINLLYDLLQEHIYLTHVQASHRLPACLSASPSSSNLHLSKQARCHTDSGTQRCQGLAAAHNMVLVRPLCQPKRSSENPAHFIILLLMTPHPIARAADGDDDRRERHAMEQLPFGALLLFKLPHRTTNTECYLDLPTCCYIYYKYDIIHSD